MSEFDDIQDLPTVARALSEGYQYTAMYPYMDQYGVVPLYWKLRLDHPDGRKWTRPVFRTIGDAYELGEPVHVKDSILKPLYNQHLPAKFPDAHVWLVEGEKCADRLNAFFATNGVLDQHIALTSGSATSADKADLTRLYGRKVTIWPDHDPEGQRYADILCQRLVGHVMSISILAVGALNLSKKEDCVDWFMKYSDATIAHVLSLPTVPLPEPKLEVEFINMGDLEMKPVNWLWPDRIACGKVTLIAGNPGLGKSQITAMLAAHVTKGIAWPDLPDTPITTGSVVFLSAEDDPADTILPRLIAADADIMQCRTLKAIKTVDRKGAEQVREFDLSQDLNRLRAALQQIGNVRLIIIDPVSAYIGKTNDSNNAEIRGLMAPLSIMAADMGAAVVLITHLNKSTSQDAIGRVIGSIGMIAAARAGYAVSKDPKNPDVRHFVPLKNNIGNDRDGFSFTIQGRQLSDTIKSSRIIWGDTVEAQKVLYPEDEKPTQTNGAKAFLKEVLGNGPRMAEDIFEEADGAGYSKQSIQRAATRLEVVRKKKGMKGGWEWILPSMLPISRLGEDIEDVEDFTI